MEDPRLSGILTECQNRVRSIGLVHESLHRSADMSSVDFESYLGNLIANLLLTYGTTRGVAVDVDAKEPLGIDAAIPCGMIVNELVSNALKHAFPGGRQGAWKP